MNRQLVRFWLSFIGAATALSSWSRLKLERTTRKVYLIEKIAIFRDDYRRCRHYAFVFYDEFHNNSQTRRDYLTQARLHKKNMLRARQKLAVADAIFSRSEKLLMMIGSVSAAVVATTIIALH